MEKTPQLASRQMNKILNMQLLQLFNFFCGDTSTAYFEHCVNFRHCFLCETLLTTLDTSQSVYIKSFCQQDNE